MNYSPAIQLFGMLLLAIMGFVVPIVGIVLSMFSSGLKQLTEKYTNEKEKAKENIIKQTEKLKEKEKINIDDVKRSIKELEKIERKTSSGLSYLKPKNILLKNFYPIVDSFFICINSS